MPTRQKNLKTYNTLGFAAQAEYFEAPISTEQAIDTLKWWHKRGPMTILGGGSNVILGAQISGLILHPAWKDITPTALCDDKVLIHVGAGCRWHSLVEYCLTKQWYGLENLALIPGCVGAAPVQNIGAYGVEVAELIEHVEVIDLDTFERREIPAKDCHFSYRQSNFKRHWQGRYLITGVTFSLSTTPSVNADYATLATDLKLHNIHKPTPQDVFDSVCRVRQQRLPDPRVIGNVGSFFHNPIVDGQTMQALKRAFPAIKAYPLEEQQFKIAAGWLIEQAGWRGYREEHVGVHDQQALVLIHHGQGCAQDLISLADSIANDIFAKFGLKLTREPQYIAH